MPQACSLATTVAASSTSHLKSLPGVVSVFTFVCKSLLVAVVAATRRVAGFTGTADVYSLGVSVAELSQKFLNIPGRERRSVMEVQRDWANVISKGTGITGIWEASGWQS